MSSFSIDASRSASTMFKRVFSIVCVFACVASTFPGWAQDVQPVAATTTSNSVVPTVSKYTGTLKDLSGKPVTTPASITFSIYKDADGGDPLWSETQNVEPDRSGQYTVTLGSTSSEGLPPS